VAVSLSEHEVEHQIAESKAPLDAVGIVTQLPIGACAWERWASSRVSGGTPPRQGVHVFFARVFGHVLVSTTILAAKTTGTSAY
jgi:hypothetical protein